MSDLERRLEQVRRKREENIRLFGYTIDMVMPGEVIGQNDYHTHGLLPTFGFEIQIVLPIAPETAGAIINDLVPRMRKNEVCLDLGRPIMGVIARLSVMIIELGRAGIPIRRIILPDMDGNLDRNSMQKDYAVQYTIPEPDRN